MSRNEPIINHVLLERVLQIKESELLHDDSFKVWEDDIDDVQKIKLTRLGKMAESMSKEEMAVLVLIAVQNYPEMVFQIMMEEYLINREGKGKRNEDSKII